MHHGIIQPYRGDHQPLKASHNHRPRGYSKKDRSEYQHKVKTRAEQAKTYLENIGFKVTQRNGQRISIMGGPQPPDDNCNREVFIGKLPRDMFEDEILHILYSTRIGRVYKIRLMMDFSGSTRGFGFVLFMDPQDAASACLLLNDVNPRPWNSEHKTTIGVVPSLDNKTLWMGKLPATMTESILVEQLNKIVSGVDSVQIPECHVEHGLRHAFVKFKTHDDATKARRVLCPNTVTISGRKIKVDWAKPEVQSNMSTLIKAQSTVVQPINLDLNNNTHCMNKQYANIADFQLNQARNELNFYINNDYENNLNCGSYQHFGSNRRNIVANSPLSPSEDLMPMNIFRVCQNQQLKSMF